MRTALIPLNDIACLAHENNRVLCLLMKDYSQPDWDDAPEWQTDSARAGVAFHLVNPDASDSASHENWMAAKVADGWVFGLTKCADSKTHPCIVPFDELPPMQQLKDRMFRYIVHSCSKDPLT